MSGSRPASTWSEAAAMIGQEIGRVVGPDIVTVGDFRRKLEVLAFDCPLHYDATVAQSVGYRTVVAPVSMTRLWAVAPTWQPGGPRPGGEAFVTLLPMAEVPGHGDTIIAAKLTVDHHEPVYPGDRIAGTAVLRAVTPKTTRVGTGAFIDVETRYTNQDDAVVSIENASLFRFDRDPSTPGTGSSDRARAAAGDGPAAAGDGHSPPGDETDSAQDAFQASGIRAAGDVRVGMPVRPIRWPVTLQRLVMEAAANRDFSPWHFDDDVARALGAPAAFANTTLLETLLEVALRSWGGLTARIARLQFRMGGHNCVGDTLVTGGVVTGKRSHRAFTEATLDLWIDGPRGRTVTASATLSLPSRTRS